MDLIEAHHATHIKDLKVRLTRNQRLTLYIEFGIQWEETAKQCIEVYNEELLRHQSSMTYKEYIQENNHHDTRTHPTDTHTTSFDDLLRVNNIDKDAFCTSVHNIMNKKMERVNTLGLQSPTTTGKSLMLKLICQNHQLGTVQRSGDHSQFFLQNLLDKSVGLMEEPRITIQTVQDFKGLFRGTPFDIHVKPSPDEPLNCQNHGPLSVRVISLPGMVAGGKRIAVDSTSEDDAPGETAQSTAKHIRLLRPSYNTTTITITRKQHLTIKQYKPADTTLTYSIICLPISIFEFWALQSEQQYAEPFATLRAAFPLCSFNHATLRLSHYIPLQKSLQGTTATDVTAFNSAPYMYTAQDHTGLLNTVPTDVTEAAHLNQGYKVNFNTYCQFTYDQGLLACNDVHTLSANEIYFKRFDFDHHPRFLTRTPLPVPRGYRYMPDDYYANTSPYPFLSFYVESILLNSDNLV
ncbi:unnamed protein product [Dicrocoelium dendriticum]|nr:unnamed protein product [Dicrocoelium dendriticum]